MATLRRDYATDALIEALPAMLAPFGLGPDPVHGDDFDAMVTTMLDALCDYVQSQGVHPHEDAHGNRW